MSSAQLLWNPSQTFKESTELHNFIKQCNFDHYDDLYAWSVSDLAGFWNKVWDFCNIISTQRGEVALLNEENIKEAIFFPNAKLNFAQNLLRKRDDTTAIHFFDEHGNEKEISFKCLYDQVSQLTKQLRAWGIQPGDVVAGYLPNLPETVIAMLATASIGATWTACSPDFGVSSVLDRFMQVEPKVLITCDGYFYNGKAHNCLERLPKLLNSLPSVQHTVIVEYANNFEIKHHTTWDKILKDNFPCNIDFAQMPFNHPLFIMFSSGTTGKPKCIVHGAGGTLIQHLKEHRLHCNIKKDDRVFYYTTCSWMMWHWLVSSLASEACIILYEGSPVIPEIGTLFDIAEKSKMTFFGTSAKYLASIEKENFKPTQNLSNLRTIASTGSPLAPNTFEYVYTHIKQDVHLASISGGTDIISCFMLGNPLKPVYKGQLQGAGLGLAVDVFNDSGKSITQQQGELVCTKPFPSRPIGFWNDIDGTKYHDAYFNKFANTWHHGDFIERTAENGFIVYGRSDTVLNPGGVRIGTAEIYQQVESIVEVAEALAIGQEWDGDVRVILFVVLRNNLILDDHLISIIKQHIRCTTTPRHVPAKVIQVQELPKTNNGKLAEIAVRQVIHGQEVKNKESLINPKSLEQFLENSVQLQLSA